MRVDHLLRILQFIIAPFAPLLVNSCYRRVRCITNILDIDVPSCSPTRFQSRPRCFFFVIDISDGTYLERTVPDEIIA